MALLRSAFPNTRIEPETTVNLWSSLYINEDFSIAKKATELIIKTSTFFPTHKEFSKALFACRGPATPHKELPAYSDETVQKKIDAICEWWANDED